MVRSVNTSEALRILQGEGAILDIAREASQILRAAGIDGAVIGGVAVVLHGHVRTTVDVDVYLPAQAERFADELRKNGFAFDPAKREFVKNNVPVHLVLPDQVRSAPAQRIELDGILTVSLADLINMKLRSGSRSVLRAQDLADVIGLMRHHQLTGEFTPRIDKDLRPEFRRLLDALAREA